MNLIFTSRCHRSCLNNVASERSGLEDFWCVIKDNSSQKSGLYLQYRLEIRLAACSFLLGSSENMQLPF